MSDHWMKERWMGQHWMKKRWKGDHWMRELDEGKCDGEGCLTFKPQYFCHYYMLLIVLVCCIEVAPVDFSKPPLSPLTISWEAVAYITDFLFVMLTIM